MAMITVSLNILASSISQRSAANIHRRRSEGLWCRASLLSRSEVDSFGFWHPFQPTCLSLI